jgi:hypothetical protein
MREGENREEMVFQELERKLRRASQEALDRSIVDQRDQQENEVLSGFLSGRLSLKQYHEQDPRGDKLYPGEVQISTIEELGGALRLLVGSEVADELTEHEADHYRVAVENGFAETKILVRFDQSGFRPAIQIILPKEGDDLEIREKLQAVIEAPDELSDTDRDQLGRK